MVKYTTETQNTLKRPQNARTRKRARRALCLSSFDPAGVPGEGVHYEKQIDNKTEKRVARTVCIKKDGGAFAVLSKNFTGCKFSGDTKVVVYFRDENDRFCDDYINIFLWAEGRVMTPDEVQAEIEKTVANYEKWRDIDTNGAENIADDLQSMIPALDRLKALINDMKADNTHYTAQAFIKEYLNIL